MFNLISQVPVTFWAAISFRARAEFSQPAPTFSIIPLPHQTKGARFRSFQLDTPIPGVINVLYDLDEELDDAERIEIPAIHIPVIMDTSPLFPIPVVTTALVKPRSTYQQTVVANSNPIPPQFSPTVELEFHTTIFRVIPLGMAATED